MSFIDEDSSVRYLVDLTHNGYEYVDLGLSVKWATCNVGATSPEQTGLYFAWGETTGYTAEQVPDDRAFIDDVYHSGPAASISADLTLEQDAAHVNLGGNWRMPTATEYMELFDNCDNMWTDNYNETGVAGLVFTSKVNGNSVFFPAAGICNENSPVKFVGSYGNYWGASYTDNNFACCMYFGDSGKYIGDDGRFCGYSVRGVFK